MQITSMFYDLATEYSKCVGLQSEFAKWSSILLGAAIVIAVLKCFFGLKVFKAMWAATAFFLTGIGVHFMFKYALEQQKLVVIMLVLGVIVAIFSFKVYKLGVFIVCGLMAYNVLSPFSPPWVAVMLGVIVGLLSIKLTQQIIIFATAISGAITLGEQFGVLIGHKEPWAIIAAIALAIVGVIVQNKLSKKRLIPRIFGKKRK